MNEHCLELRLVSDILEVRPSEFRPDDGVIEVRTTTTNQSGEAVRVAAVHGGD